MRDIRDGSMGQGTRVAVFGATGHTGRFVVEELARRGLVPVAVGRDAGKLAGGFAGRGVAVREASIDDAASLDRAFAGTRAVINCAGPFLDTADAVAAAALRAGGHYLDVTAEQASAQATFARFDAPARAAGCVVLPAMGFYGGFADLLATRAMGDWEHADAIRVGIALDSWHPTEGTRITGRRNTAPRLVVADGRLAPLPQPSAETDWVFPQPFARQRMVALPFSEIVVIARHLDTRTLDTWLGTAALQDVRDPTTPPPRPADASGRSAQRFAIEVRVERGGRVRRVAAQGRDIYAFSAPLVCEAAQRLLGGAYRETGAHAPGAIFDAEEYLQALAAEFLELETDAMAA